MLQCFYTVCCHNQSLHCNMRLHVEVVDCCKISVLIVNQFHHIPLLNMTMTTLPTLTNHQELKKKQFKFRLPFHNTSFVCNYYYFVPLMFLPHHTTSDHTTSHHTTSRHITSHHITSHHIRSHHITSHHIRHYI